MGALSNSGRKTANMAGFYKGIQSAGAAVFWALDGAKVSYRVLYGVTVSGIVYSLIRIVLALTTCTLVRYLRSFYRHRLTSHLAPHQGYHSPRRGP